MKKLSNPHHEILENGVWVATESLPHVRSASIGVYLDTGSRDETPALNGLSHFFEHMVFKGTRRLDPLDIVQRFEATGGHVNAYTSKEQTCFHGKVVDSQLPPALDALLDMLLEARFDPKDVEKEKEVIIEEIRSVDDSPDEFAYELFSKAAFGAHALAKPIAGTAKSVRALTREALIRHREGARKNTPVAVVAVGRVDHAEIVDQVRKKFGLGRNRRNATAMRSTPRSALSRFEGSFEVRHLVKNKDVQQATVILGGPACSWNSPQRFPAMLIHCALGDGMSSRLFQNVREKHALVYNIFSNPEFLAREGVFNVGFATEHKNIEKAVREIGRELAALRKNGLTKKELDSAKENVVGGVLLGLESTGNRMSSIARLILNGNLGETLEHLVKSLEAVTPAEVRATAREMLRPDRWSSSMVLPKNVKIDLGALLAKA